MRIIANKYATDSLLNFKLVLVWLVHREQRSPVCPIFQLNSQYSCSANQFFVNSNDLKAKLCKCDRVAMIKSTTNRHIKLFARTVV